MATDAARRPAGAEPHKGLKQRISPASQHVSDWETDAPERDVELRGYPTPAAFALGGKRGHVVIASESSSVRRGWRCVAVDGKRLQGPALIRALDQAQRRNGKYTVTFKLVGERKASEDGSGSFQKAARDAVAGARAERADRLRVGGGGGATGEAGLDAPGAPVDGSPAAAPAADDGEDGHEPEPPPPSAEEVAAAAAAERATLLEAAHATTQLPPRAEVAEPQRALLSALSRPTHAQQARAAAARNTPGPCAKCDGPHDTARCPHFPQSRDEHRDAWLNVGKSQEAVEAEAAARAEPDADDASELVDARVVPQPGDGSCLFHSLCHGLGLGLAKAKALRREVADFVEASAEVELADAPLRDWVLWDSGLDVRAYAARMRTMSAWGGAIEMAVVAHVRRAVVRVYERSEASARTFRLITQFDAGGGVGDAEQAPAPPKPPATTIINVLYSGGAHYDVLETGPGWWDRVP